MKTQKNTLEFEKKSITELNDNLALGINGGCQWSDSSGPTKTIFKSIIIQGFE